VEFSLIRDGSDPFPDDRAEVTVVERGDPVVVRVAGRMLYDTLPPLADTMAQLTSGGCPRLILDLSEVAMCDSSGLNLLVRTRAKLADAGGWLRLAGAQPMVGNVLEITNLTRILPCYTTVDAARPVTRQSAVDVPVRNAAGG
jgi:anti-anti-sigma factor